MKSKVRKIFTKLQIYFSEKKYKQYLKDSGILIGENFIIRGNHRTVHIDLSRPSLISIGDNVTINSNFTIFTHDFVSGVFLNKYGDFLPSSGRVKIGNNVRFGVNCTILKNVSIGDNCFIAAGSVVVKDIPANSIAGGVPAKVICSIDDYYNKRKHQCVIEAKEYARSIVARFNRAPIPADFWEEFPLFVDASNIEDYPEIPIKRQLGSAYEFWCANHKKTFKDFDDFINSCNE